MCYVELAEFDTLLVRGVTPTTFFQMKQTTDINDPAELRSLVREISPQTILVIAREETLSLRTKSVEGVKDLPVNVSKFIGKTVGPIGILAMRRDPVKVGYVTIADDRVRLQFLGDSEN